MLVRTDRKSAFWWCSGDFCEEESSVYFFYISPGILDIELIALCKPARYFTTELHSQSGSGVSSSWRVVLSQKQNYLLVPCISSGMLLCMWGGENFWAWQRPWDYLVTIHSILLRNTAYTERSANLTEVLGWPQSWMRLEPCPVLFQLLHSVTDMCSACMLMCVACLLSWLHTNNTWKAQSVWRLRQPQ